MHSPNTKKNRCLERATGMDVILREHLQFHYNKKMERLLIRVPLLLVEWLNPVGSGAMFLL